MDVDCASFPVELDRASPAEQSSWHWAVSNNTNTRACKTCDEFFATNRRRLAGPEKGRRPEWLRRLGAGRQLCQEDFSPAIYDMPELRWTQTNFVANQMLVMDKMLWDARTQSFTVESYLRDMSSRFGGITSIILWPTYPSECSSRLYSLMLRIRL